MENTPPTPRVRIANACKFCKDRKIKCNGQHPCGNCDRRDQPCIYPPERTRKRRLSHDEPDSNHRDGSTLSSIQQTSAAASTARNLPNSDLPNEDETEVQREARLLRDDRGKLIFIGDCAPLSFFQSVKHLIETHVDAEAFPPETSSSSVLSNPRQMSPEITRGRGPPAIDVRSLEAHVKQYNLATKGIVDVFSLTDLYDPIASWASSPAALDSTSIVFYLVLAIGAQDHDKALARTYFQHSFDKALSLSGEMSIATVQAFILIPLYLLRAGQSNGAFLFFGTAVRAGYTIGLHRHEINRKQEGDAWLLRDNLWMSLRVLDLFLSSMLGRPPATSDVDCTVYYCMLDQLVNASVQIFLITETIVVEVFSRRRISLGMTEDISKKLREWSQRYTEPLNSRICTGVDDQDPAEASGACQVMATYYYAVMLISRPFLMYEARRRVSAMDVVHSHTATSPNTGRSKLADACVNAACLMADLINSHLEDGLLAGSFPLLTSWLFAASLALGIGLAAGFGRTLHKTMRKSIQSLEHFSRFDDHAKQYAQIASRLLETAQTHLEKQDELERSQRTKRSSKLFGLLPMGPQLSRDSTHEQSLREAVRQDHRNKHPAPDGRPIDALTVSQQDSFPLTGTADQTPDMSFFEGWGPAPSDVDWETLNLFPFLEEGGLDGTHHFGG